MAASCTALPGGLEFDSESPSKVTKQPATLSFASFVLKTQPREGEGGWPLRTATSSSPEGEGVTMPPPQPPLSKKILDMGLPFSKQV